MRLELLAVAAALLLVLQGADARKSCKSVRRDYEAVAGPLETNGPSCVAARELLFPESYEVNATLAACSVAPSALANMGDSARDALCGNTCFKWIAGLVDAYAAQGVFCDITPASLFGASCKANEECAPGSVCFGGACQRKCAAGNDTFSSCDPCHETCTMVLGGSVCLPMTECSLNDQAQSCPGDKKCVDGQCVDTSLEQFRRSPLYFSKLFSLVCARESSPDAGAFNNTDAISGNNTTSANNTTTTTGYCMPHLAALSNPVEEPGACASIEALRDSCCMSALYDFLAGCHWEQTPQEQRLLDTLLSKCGAHPTAHAPCSNYRVGGSASVCQAPSDVQNMYRLMNITINGTQWTSDDVWISHASIVGVNPDFFTNVSVDVVDSEATALGVVSHLSVELDVWTTFWYPDTQGTIVTLRSTEGNATSNATSTTLEIVDQRDGVTWSATPGFTPQSLSALFFGRWEGYVSRGGCPDPSLNDTGSENSTGLAPSCWLEVEFLATRASILLNVTCLGAPDLDEQIELVGLLSTTPAQTYVGTFGAAGSNSSDAAALYFDESGNFTLCLGNLTCAPVSARSEGNCSYDANVLSGRLVCTSGICASVENNPSLANSTTTTTTTTTTTMVSPTVLTTSTVPSDEGSNSTTATTTSPDASANSTLPTTSTLPEDTNSTATSTSSPTTGSENVTTPETTTSTTTVATTTTTSESSTTTAPTTKAETSTEATTKAATSSTSTSTTTTTTRRAGAEGTKSGGTHRTSVGLGVTFALLALVAVLVIVGKAYPDGRVRRAWNMLCGRTGGKSYKAFTEEENSYPYFSMGESEDEL